MLLMQMFCFVMSRDAAHGNVDKTQEWRGIKAIQQLKTHVPLFLDDS